MQKDIIPIARLIDTNNIRYNILQDITNAEFSTSNINTVNLYIDMYSILKVLYRNDNFDIDDYSSITSSIVNICAHYRNFYKTRYGVYTRIFIINSDNLSPINRKFVYKYNEGYKLSIEMKQKVRDMVDYNMGLLRTLVPYLPHIYFIDTTFESSVVMYDIMSRDDKRNEKAHVILTKDPYVYQLTAMKPNTVILRKKDKDTAYYINANNLINTYLKERNVKERDTTMSPGLYTMMLALSSFKQRNMKSVTSISKAISVIESAIKDHRIANIHNTSDHVWKSLLLYGGIKSNEIDLMNRFKALDVPYAHMIFMESPERDFNDRLINLDDPDAVRAINNEYFKNNPLDLNNL